MGDIWATKPISNKPGCRQYLVQHGRKLREFFVSHALQRQVTMLKLSLQPQSKEYVRLSLATWEKEISSTYQEAPEVVVLVQVNYQHFPFTVTGCLAPEGH